MSQGVLVTVNSDNMSVSGTNVIREFQQLNTAFHLTIDEVQQLLLNSVNASFASESLKEDLRKVVKERVGRIR